MAEGERDRQIQRRRRANARQDRTQNDAQADAPPSSAMSSTSRFMAAGAAIACAEQLPTPGGNSRRIPPSVRKRFIARIGRGNRSMSVKTRPGRCVITRMRLRENRPIRTPNG